MRDMTRREAVGTLGTLGALAAGAALSPRAAWAGALDETPRASLRLKHSVSRWCYGKMSLDDLCATAKGIGYDGIDLLDPADWPIVKQHGLVCSMAFRTSSASAAIAPASPTATASPTASRASSASRRPRRSTA